MRALNRGMMAALSLAALAATASACNGTSAPKMNACAQISGCTVTTDGYKFPDGNGGTVSCSKGRCVDSNPDKEFEAAFNAGLSNGSNIGGRNGYRDGYGSGYNNGYSSGYNSGYNAGYTPPPTYHDDDWDDDDWSDDDDWDNGGDDGDWGNGGDDGDWGGGDDNSGDNSGDDSGGDSGGWDDNSGDDGDNTSGYSAGSRTKDVDLQKAVLQKLSVQTRAQNIANQFQMNYDSAVQLTRLSDRVRLMTVQGKMTAADRAAIQQSALDIAGITTEDINAAVDNLISGNPGAMDDLMETAAGNLGMPSSAALRDKLLPALGIE